MERLRTSSDADLRLRAAAAFREALVRLAADPPDHEPLRLALEALQGELAAFQSHAHRQMLEARREAFGAANPDGYIYDRAYWQGVEAMATHAHAAIEALRAALAGRAP